MDHDDWERVLSEFERIAHEPEDGELEMMSSWSVFWSAVQRFQLLIVLIGMVVGMGVSFSKTMATAEENKKAIEALEGKLTKKIDKIATSVEKLTSIELEAQIRERTMCRANDLPESTCMALGHDGGYKEEAE